MKPNNISDSLLWTPKKKFMIVSNEINKECLPDIILNVKLSLTSRSFHVIQF